jgi:hypothetical protein
LCASLVGCLLFGLASCEAPTPADQVAATSPAEPVQPSVVRKRVLDAEHAQHTVLTQRPDGKLETSCVRGREAAEALVERANRGRDGK